MPFEILCANLRLGIEKVESVDGAVRPGSGVVSGNIGKVQSLAFLIEPAKQFAGSWRSTSTALPRLI